MRKKRTPHRTQPDLFQSPIVTPHWHMLEELGARRTQKAVAHFQACIINEKVNSTGRVNLYRLNQRLPPHERAYLYELAEKKKSELLSASQTGRLQADHAAGGRVDASSGRTPGAEQEKSGWIREPAMSAGEMERRLLNGAVDALCRGPGGLAVSEARGRSSDESEKETHLHAQNRKAQEWAGAKPSDRNRFVDGKIGLAEETFHQASERLDLQQRGLELTNNQTGPSPAERRELGQDIESKLADRLRLVVMPASAEMPGAARLPIAEDHDFLPGDVDSTRSGRALPDRKGYVGTDRVWHFDSLSASLDKWQGGPDDPTQEHRGQQTRDERGAAFPER